MHIRSIRIRNLRTFKDEEVVLGAYTSLVGPNGAGKSTVLCALNIFFQETQGTSTNLSSLDIEDFHSKITEDPIAISVTFDGLSSEAQKEFGEYYRQGVLAVSAQASYDANTGTAVVKQYGQRKAMDRFKTFFQMYNDGKSAADLRAEYENIRADITDLPKPGSKDANREALRTYEEAHPDDCVLIPSEDQFGNYPVDVA